MAEALPPWEEYARRKVAESGGSHDDYSTRWNAATKQMTEIAQQRGLLKGSDFVTLDHAGLVAKLPQEAHSYGLDTVVGFYSILGSKNNPDLKAWARTLFNLDESSFNELEHKVEEKLGGDYIRLHKEIYS